MPFVMDLTEKNVTRYFLSVAPKIWRSRAVLVIKAEEVTEETYVNYIFRVGALVDHKKTVVYLRQTRDHVKVKPERKLDPNRVVNEAKILKLIGGIVPGVVPQVLYLDNVNNVLFLSDIKRHGRLLVKELVAGRAHPETGLYFGRVLGTIHAKTRGISHRLVRGSALENGKAVDFHLGMRLEPALSWYPLPTQNLLKDSRSAIKTLVEGDLASKNIFIEGRRVRFLDLERAFVGDPAFDLAFLFCHYLIEIKPQNFKQSVAFLGQFMKGYCEALGKRLSAGELTGLKNRVIRFLGVTILYRLFGFYQVIQLERDKEKWKRVAEKLLSSTDSDLVRALKEVDVY
jgi:tRNA A-37 threonylcarbamoyl transferase component Bud32